MASIIKRGNSWRASISRKGFRKTATFDKKKDAEIWAKRYEANILDFGSPQEEQINESDSITLNDLFSRYGQKVSPNKRGYRFEITRFKAFKKFPIFSLSIHEVTPQKLAQWRDSRLKIVKSSTVNRDFNLISSVINYAIKEWGLNIPVNPVHMIKRPQDPPARDRRISEEEKNKIAKSLKWDGETQPTTVQQWVAFSLFLAIETAMRRGEITSILWKNVNLKEDYVYLEMTKNGDSRYVPLSNKAKNLIQILKKGEADEHMVPIHPDCLSTLFRRAAKLNGLENIRFHDSRREATTRISKRLPNVLELSAVTGHKTLNNLKRYYRPIPADLAKKLNEES